MLNIDGFLFSVGTLFRSTIPVFFPSTLPVVNDAVTGPTVTKYLPLEGEIKARQFLLAGVQSSQGEEKMIPTLVKMSKSVEPTLPPPVDNRFIVARCSRKYERASHAVVGGKWGSCMTWLEEKRVGIFGKHPIDLLANGITVHDP
ncbi:hypothetical protein HZH68_007632 [Vespula germanica]|uniref:Uncharacterized protein n=1 Tax=Vespula germanica TaxID=30212 RepID=A0A834K825_VESGE|nr:hypothetical protein HZH68_007632 [Vespula germanica]